MPRHNLKKIMKSRYRCEVIFNGWVYSCGGQYAAYTTIARAFAGGRRFVVVHDMLAAGVRLVVKEVNPWLNHGAGQQVATLTFDGKEWARSVN